jgi:hypothetical protein
MIQFGGMRVGKSDDSSSMYSGDSAYGSVDGRNFSMGVRKYGDSSTVYSSDSAYESATGSTSTFSSMRAKPSKYRQVRLLLSTNMLYHDIVLVATPQSLHN